MGNLVGRLRRIPLLGGVIGFFAMLHDVYEAIGWTDPAYHSIRSAEERLDEVRRVGALGAPQDASDRAEDPAGSANPPDDPVRS